MSKGTYSFTTPIYYVNAAPHLGTAYTTIAADTVARYQRMNGYDVAFVTGMDEHGQKVAATAAAKGMTPQDWCDSMEPAFRDAWDMLGITYTDFVRTTEPRHAKSVQKFWQELYDKGWCYKGSYEGWYCVHEETYYAESDLEKNDEGQLVCPDCKRPVQKAGGEENWFFKLSEFGDKLLAFYEENPDFIRPETRKNEIVSFVKSGLKDLSISRSTFELPACSGRWRWRQTRPSAAASRSTSASSTSRGSMLEMRKRTGNAPGACRSAVAASSRRSRPARRVADGSRLAPSQYDPRLMPVSTISPAPARAYSAHSRTTSSAARLVARPRATCTMQ